MFPSRKNAIPGMVLFATCYLQLMFYVLMSIPDCESLTLMPFNLFFNLEPSPFVLGAEIALIWYLFGCHNLITAQFIK